MSTFKANAYLLKNLLDSIENGEIQLPDFQRGWVWDDARTSNGFLHQDLLVSISRGFPIGTVMTLDASGDVQFVSKVIEGVVQPRVSRRQGRSGAVSPRRAATPHVAVSIIAA